MLIAVDIGNTQVVFGLFEQDKLCYTFRAATERARTADEYGVLLRQLLTLRGVNPQTVSAAIVASVVPELTDVLGDAIRQAFARTPLVVGPGLKTGMSILYDNPREVGADRIVNAVAAYERFRQGLIVVDFGTATTFDCVSPRAEYVGGVIAPGIQVSLSGLVERAAKLSRVEIAEPPRVVGRNTAHALQSGVIHGYASLVDGLVIKICNELDFDCKVIATGGLAPLVTRRTEHVRLVDPDLTLRGLQILHTRNTAARRDREPANGPEG